MSISNPLHAMLLDRNNLGLAMRRAEAIITMSMCELDRMKVIQSVMEGNLKPGIAAQRLQLTTRQVRRLVRRYKSEGPSGLASKRRGRPSNHQLSPGLERKATRLLREHYADFGPTLASEKLAEQHGLRLAKETVRRIMRDAGLWTPRKLRPPKIHQPRNRRACLGELIQIDGCEHAWFEDRAPSCTLLVYVDDATSRIMHMHFAPSESTFSYFEATRGYLEQHGKPQAFYSDKASIFRINKKNVAGGDGHTQFARAMYELCIEVICANSSQAKGRVERTDKVMYLIEDSEETRSLAGHYIDVYQYPDGRVALHAQGHTLPLRYTYLDRLSEIDQGAIVENKRLGHVLRVLQEVQSVRDNRRSLHAPSLTHIGEAPRRRGRPPGKKSSRALDAADMLNALNATTT